MNEERMGLLKRNLIRLVEDHREKETADCNVSLGLVLELAVLAGLEFTEQEKELFV